jgi:monolysocardiolipin acyltransferase
MRHALGSYDICFKNPATSWFFARGQVIPTYRLLHGDPGGLFQPTVSHAIQLLSETAPNNEQLGEGGKWMHIHPEGRTFQSSSNIVRYFKWGIARMLLETQPEPPRLVPMFIQGFDHVMPEDRTWPRFLPRVGTKKSKLCAANSDMSRKMPEMR